MGFAAAIGQTLNGRKHGRQWMVRCVAHADRTPSLALRDGDGGRLLVHCHAGRSGSVIVVAGYLVKTKGWTVQAAYDFIATKRARYRKVYLTWCTDCPASDLGN